MCNWQILTYTVLCENPISIIFGKFSNFPKYFTPHYKYICTVTNGNGDDSDKSHWKVPNVFAESFALFSCRVSDREDTYWPWLSHSCKLCQQYFVISVNMKLNRHATCSMQNSAPAVDYICFTVELQKLNILLPKFDTNDTQKVAPLWTNQGIYTHTKKAK